MLGPAYTSPCPSPYHPSSEKNHIFFLLMLTEMHLKYGNKWYAINSVLTLEFEGTTVLLLS